MATNLKYYLGTLAVTHGEYEERPRLLVVANSEERAHKVLLDAAANYYGSSGEDDEDDEDELDVEDGGFYANGGEVHIAPAGLAEIGFATFCELRRHMWTAEDDNVRLPELEQGLTDTFKAGVRSMASALEARGVKVKHADLLHAAACALGAKNWQVLAYRLKLAEVQPPLEPVPVKSTGQLQELTVLAAGARTARMDGQEFEIRSKLDGAGQLQELELLATEQQGKPNRVVLDAKEFDSFEQTDPVSFRMPDGRTLSFYIEPRRFRVSVARIGYGANDIEVIARTAAEAKELALDEAGNHLYSEHTSEYEVNGVSSVDESA